jgi:cell wall-associated NlpC family hydrolase
MRRTHRLSRLAIAAATSLTTIVMVAPAAYAAPARSVEAPAKPASYTVKAGDNLYTLARSMKVRLKDLLSVNKLTIDSRILPGDVLLVPVGGVVPTATSSTPAAQTPVAAAPAAAPAATGAPATTYVLAKGEGLWNVARKFGVKLGSLMKANSLKIDSVVHPGTTLTIPAGGTVAVSPTTTAPGPVNNPPQAAAAPAAAPVAAPVAPPAGSPVDTVVTYATAQLGKPYVFNTAGPDSFDCSGLTVAAYQQIGVSLPHQSAMQATRGTAVDWRAEPIRPGDLVFAFSSNNTSVISHVGIAISATQWIHAPRAGDVVKIGTIPAATKIQAVRRFVTP